MLSPHPPSFGPYNPPYCEFFFSHVSNISFEFHEDQVLDGFGVEKPTCDIIYDDYVWEPIVEEKSTMKDAFLPSAPLPHHPNIFRDSVISFEGQIMLFLIIHQD